MLEFWANFAEFCEMASDMGFENLPEIVIPMHPGAIRYFEEQGVDIPDRLRP